MRSTAWATGLAVGGRSLWRAAEDVAQALTRGDVEGARALLPNLVGRDPNNLDEEEIVRAVVESVAENTVDAIVAPVLWAAVAGAPGALGYRAVNTMDAMVGHHSERYEHYGWASARLDDVELAARSSRRDACGSRAANFSPRRSRRRLDPGHGAPLTECGRRRSRLCGSAWCTSWRSQSIRRSGGRSTDPWLWTCRHC